MEYAYYLSPGEVARYWDDPVCLYVCLSVCPANENFNV